MDDEQKRCIYRFHSQILSQMNGMFSDSFGRAFDSLVFSIVSIVLKLKPAKRYAEHLNSK